MKRRSFLAALVGAPVVAALPAVAAQAPSTVGKGGGHGPDQVITIDEAVRSVDLHRVYDEIYDESGFVIGRAY